MQVDVLLMHGYTGSPEDLRLLSKALGKAGMNVINPLLPGHSDLHAPRFNAEDFVAHILDLLKPLTEIRRKLVLIGHSTGGCLLVAALLESGIEPDLLILVNTPQRIDMNYLDRWKRHRKGKTEVDFSSVARMVSFINRIGSRHLPGSFQVLSIGTLNDELVPPSDAREWATVFCGAFRSVEIPGVHHLFDGEGNTMALDIVHRAVTDVLNDAGDLDRLVEVEPKVGEFLARNPLSARHLAGCPSVIRMAGDKPALSSEAVTEPVFANIEITTRCNLHCKYCARARDPDGGQDMTLDSFKRILEYLPHAYRITLVGLGEPLLHPQVVEFVAYASSLGRRVALVTNAMLLDPNISQELVDAGIDAVTFSFDAADQEKANILRPGTFLEHVIRNIESFTEIAAGHPHIDKAVFTAVSKENVTSLKNIVDLVSGLNVHVLMLSDLNFSENTGHSLSGNIDKETMNLVRAAIKNAFERNLPVLGVRGIEEFGMANRYHDHLLIPPDQLYRRSRRLTWCLSPWQTVAVAVDGSISFCDCRPEETVGNLLSDPFTNIWNGEKMKMIRGQMLNSDPPEACRICPRF